MSEFIARATGAVIGIAVVVLFFNWTDALIDEAHQMLCDEGTLVDRLCVDHLKSDD